MLAPDTYNIKTTVLDEIRLLFVSFRSQKVDRKKSLDHLYSAFGLALSLIATLATPAKADSFLLDFETALPDSLVTVGVNSDGELVPSVPIIEAFGSNNNILRLSNEIGIPTTSIINQAQTFEDVKVSALLNPTKDSNDQILLSARIDPLSFSAYSFGVDFGANRLVLSKSVGGEITRLSEVDDILPALDQRYFAELEVVGNQLTGRLFDTTGENELFTFTKTDTDNPIISGFSGLSVDISDSIRPEISDPNNSTIDNFGSVSISVPEPSSILGILTIGSLFLGGFKRSNKQL